jgi:hypothetical protein
MAKRQTFADKAKKSKNVKTCPTCGESIEYILMVKSVERPDGRGYKFKHEQVGMCKCVEKEIFA